MFSFYFCDFFDQKLKIFWKNCCQIHIFKAFLSKLQQLLEFKSANRPIFKNTKASAFQNSEVVIYCRKTRFFPISLINLAKSELWKNFKKEIDCADFKTRFEFPQSN